MVFAGTRERIVRACNLDLEVLGDVLRRLLGIDLVERLEADLDRLTMNQVGKRKSIERLRTEVKKYRINVGSIDDKLKKLQTEAEELETVS